MRNWIRKQIKRFIGFSHFTRDGHELDEPRFNLLDIKKAVNKAKKRFPDYDICVISDIKELSLDSHTCFICAFQSDEDLLKALNKIRKIPDAYYFPAEKGFPPSRYFHQNDIAKEVLLEARKIRKKFDFNDFENIIQALETTRNIEGDYVEIGAYQGCSARVALSYMKKANINRTSYLLDVYDGMNFKGAKDSADGRWLGTHTETSVSKVRHFLRDFPKAKIVKSNIITDELPTKKIAVCNIDVDMYESVLAGLTKAAPLISVGGIMICEDAGHTPQLAGARLALSDFLQNQNSFVPIYMTSGQYLLIKIKLWA